MNKNPKHHLEAIGLKTLFFIFRKLPLPIASAIGGFLGQAIGPILSAHKTAAENIDRVFPKLSDLEKSKILFITPVRFS